MKYILATLLLIGIGMWVYTEDIGTISTVTEVPKKDPVTLVFVGDIMFDRGVRRSIETKYGNNYNALFEHTSYLKEADLAFGNLEGPAAMGGHKVGSRFSFRMNPAGLTAMRDAGFDVLSFSNNHVGDYTLAAFTETLSNIEKNGMASVGAGIKSDVRTVRVHTVRDMTIGFIAVSDVGPEWMKATDTRSGILLASDPDLETILTEADALVDILVLSIHWGAEYSPASASQVQFAKRAIDTGVDILVGHHPHVMQKVETYNGKPIFYSLGNFIFDQYFSPHTMRGMVGFVSIDPESKEISVSQQVSPLSSTFIPQPLIPFKESMLIREPFVP